MSTTSTTNVSAAFDILLEAMEEEIGLMNWKVAAAAEQRDHDRARSALNTSEQMTTSWQNVAERRNQWIAAFGSLDESDDDEGTNVVRSDLGRLQRGLRTPDQAYYLPILAALAALGGRGKSSDIVDTVGKSMQHQLRDVDFEALASDPNMPRWRNTAHWARFQMIQDGLLKDDSKRGVWEISDMGRAFLNDSGNKEQAG